MPKNIAWRKFVNNFKKFGFEGPYSGGKHLFMKKDAFKIHIPSKHKGEIDGGLVGEILHEAGIDKKMWDEL